MHFDEGILHTVSLHECFCVVILLFVWANRCLTSSPTANEARRLCLQSTMKSRDLRNMSIGVAANIQFVKRISILREVVYRFRFSEAPR